MPPNGRIGQDRATPTPESTPGTALDSFRAIPLGDHSTDIDEETRAGEGAETAEYPVIISQDAVFPCSLLT